MRCWLVLDEKTISPFDFDNGDDTNLEIDESDETELEMDELVREREEERPKRTRAPKKPTSQSNEEGQ